MPHATTTVDVTPSARRLTGSLRDIGYDFVAAVADIVDNSVTAGASTVEIEIVFDGPSSYVVIADDGTGMSERELTEGLRFGTRRPYASGELGRYGLGLKTASVSQCRRLTVATRRAPSYRRISALTLDLDHVARTDRWEIMEPPEDSVVDECLGWLDDAPGTVVVWEHLDRVLPELRPEGGWARRRLEHLAQRTAAYLGMVFHRFLEGDTMRTEPLSIAVNGEKVAAWNPFAPLEPNREELATQSFEVAVGDVYGRVLLHRYVLPPRDRFTSPDEFERLSGPGKWNRQQGLYIFRADRLVQGGGWCGLRAVDEHTKFARASVDFQTDLDGLFQINVSKMRVQLPTEVRTLLERPVHELTRRADATYRGDAERNAHQRTRNSERGVDVPRSSAAEVGTALIAAAMDAGEQSSLLRVMDRLRLNEPELAAALGW